MEAKRVLTTQQREQISQSEREFIDRGITYAEQKGTEYDKKSADAQTQ